MKIHRPDGEPVGIDDVSSFEGFAVETRLQPQVQALEGMSGSAVGIRNPSTVDYPSSRHTRLPEIDHATFTYRPICGGPVVGPSHCVGGCAMSAVKVSGSLAGVGRSSSADQLSSIATCSTA